MKSMLKLSMMFVFFILLLTLPFFQQALSSDRNCMDEGKRFIAEQLVNQKKQKHIVLERTPILIGVDALFL